jgi:hypothetical protein
MALNLCYSALMRPNQSEKNEWARMAQAAYRVGRNSIGHTYSVAASLPHDGVLKTEYFDALQSGYRNWLVFGEWPLLDDLEWAKG